MSSKKASTRSKKADTKKADTKKADTKKADTKKNDTKKADTKKNDTVYVVTSHISRKNENISESGVFVFSDQDEARRFMRDHAKQLFHDNIKVEKEPAAVKAEDDGSEEGSNGESSKKAEIRQGTPIVEGLGRRGHFFNEDEDSIHFGEDKKTGVYSYRRTWGTVSITEATIDEKKA